jgi:hypothetical protein
MKVTIFGVLKGEFVDVLSFYELYVKNDIIDDFCMK